MSNSSLTTLCVTMLFCIFLLCFTVECQQAAPTPTEDPVLTEPLIPYTYYVDNTQVTIVDGDTVRAQLDLGFDLRYNADVRLRGVDTPETRLIAQRAAGNKAKAFVSRWFSDNTKKTCRSFSWDKYGGRILGDFYDANGVSLSETIIKAGYGRPYNGEKKAPWTATELAAIEALP